MDLTAEMRPRSSMRMAGSSMAGTRARVWNFCRRASCCEAICWPSPNRPASRRRSKYFDLVFKAVVLTRKECRLMSRDALACSICSTKSPFLGAMSAIPSGSASFESLFGLTGVSTPSMVGFMLRFLPHEKAVAMYRAQGYGQNMSSVFAAVSGVDACEMQSVAMLYAGRWLSKCVGGLHGVRRRLAD